MKMAKLVFFVVFAAALVAVSVAQSYPPSSWGMQCERELQDSSLDACRQVVDEQLAAAGQQTAGQQTRWYPKIARSLRFPPIPRWVTGVRMQCCQQLQDVSRQCRCAAIRQMVREFEEQVTTAGERYDYYRGETAGQQQPAGQGGWYGGEQPGERYSYGYGEATRVSLTRARQYAAQLPAMCRLEPQECSVFSSAGQY